VISHITPLGKVTIQDSYPSYYRREEEGDYNPGTPLFLSIYGRKSIPFIALSGNVPRPGY
jgi:hypothetical protein